MAEGTSVSSVTPKSSILAAVSQSILNLLAANSGLMPVSVAFAYRDLPCFFWGYFGGRFPGRQALRKITNSWKVQVTVKHHGSGWLVFQFSSEDDKANVLGNGPYIIYGRPLLLKAMPRLFKTMGHTPEGCKENKTNSNKNEDAKPAGVAKEKGKDTEAIAFETNDQIGTSEAGTNKGNQLEWVIKKTREGKGQKGRTEESGPVVEAEVQYRASGSDPATEESQNPNSRLEPEIEDSVSKALGLSTGQTPSIPKQQKKVQVGAAVKQAIQIASAELKTNLQQPHRDLKGGAATVQKKNAAQPTGRSITATLAAKNLDRSQLPSTLTLAKGEEGKKNRDKKATVKCDKAISFAEFCAEMGEYIRKNKVDVMGILETKLKSQRTREVVKSKFRRWAMWDNFQHHPNGRIMIIWKADKVDLQILEFSEQVIHCMVVCKKLHDNTSDPLLQEQMVKMKQTAFNLAEAERSYCSQLAKMKYLKNSDRASKFFHDLIKIHRNKGQIVSIALPNGSRSKSQQEVNDLSLNSIRIYLVPVPRVLQLIEMSCWKGAPGPDGYSALFFKRAWSIIGKDFCEAIKEFFSSGQILKQMNHSVIALVPKTSGISRDDLEAIKFISGFSEGRFPFRIAGYLNAWAGMKLSYAGRCELIRSILQGVECFWLASLYIPAGIRDRLIRMCRNFLWGVGTRMEQWVLDGRFCSKAAYEFFRPRKGNLTWPKWLGISRSMGTLKAAVKWIFKEARGTGIQAKAKRIGLACTVYYIWEARNERIFEDIIKDPKDIIRRIQIQDIAVVAHGVGVGVGVGIGVSVGVDGGLYLGQVSAAVARGDAHVADASVPPVQFQLLVAEIGSGSVLKTEAVSLP
ncbi:hypothetical protein Acr_08g0014510 [Actinidia rufa]|uniref:DUF4283 domain-containing protein n=1 Tax=Actinidia rufa TaxID=165716 RepID=A0A7J0F2Y5_9ERIC|nr:hypothetical protein Acr_08g0014510 [Actinidia rufa]